MKRRGRRRVPSTFRTISVPRNTLIPHRLNIVHKTVITGTLDPATGAGFVSETYQIGSVWDPDPGSGFTANGTIWPSGVYDSYLVTGAKLTIQFMNSINTSGSSFPVLAWVSAYTDTTAPTSTNPTDVIAGMPHTRYVILNQTRPTTLVLKASVKRLHDVRNLWDEKNLYSGDVGSTTLPASPYRTWYRFSVASVDQSLNPPQVPWIATFSQRATWFDSNQVAGSREAQ